MFKRKASLLGKERRWLFYGYKNHQEVDVIDQQGLSTISESPVNDFNLGDEYVPCLNYDFTHFSDPEKLG